MDVNRSVFVNEDDGDGGNERAGKMADNGGQPTNKDLTRNMSDWLGVMERKLGALKTLEKESV